MNTMIFDRQTNEFRRWTKQDVSNALFGPSRGILTKFYHNGRWHTGHLFYQKIEKEDGSGSSFNLTGLSDMGNSYTIYVQTID